MPGHPLARSSGTCACIKAPSAASRLSQESFPENQDRLMFFWDGGGAVEGRDTPSSPAHQSLTKAWGWDGNPAIAAVSAAPRAVRIHRPPPNTWASDVYRCTEKEDSFRSCSKQFCPERNTNQTLMQSLLFPFLTCPYAEQHGKSLLTEFTAEKTI